MLDRNERGGASLGWVGTGRMGYALVSRLLDAGHRVAVYNRTRAKAEPLAERVFTMVAGPTDLREVVLGAEGLLAHNGSVPGVIVDSTTVSPGSSDEVRAAAHERGSALLAAPVSGNPKVVDAGLLTIVVSGPEQAWLQARPLLELLGAGVTYVGDGERARLVKICHNLMLGIVAQTLAEILVLAEKGGVARADFMAFLNDSVMGSMFTRYKTPAYVNLDFRPTFTPELLLKDFQLGTEAARELGVPLPVAGAAQQVVQALVGHGYTDVDFAALIEQQARASGLDLVSEDAPVDDGLGRPRGEPVSVRDEGA
jgi:3-hydroxyisobutyrate dehydrogenase